MRVGLTLLMLSFFAVPAQAEVKLVQVSADQNHRMSEVWDGQFQALDGSRFDTSAFYQSSKTTFSAAGVFAYTITPQFTALMPFTADAGYESQLYQAAPGLELGLGVLWSEASWSLGLVGRSLTRVGGGVTEQACKDSINRQFHCGTGLPWTDYQIRQPTLDRSATLSFQLRF